MCERFVITTSGIVGDTLGTINVEKAAVALGRICRYAGNCNEFWSVLVHSLVVNDLAPKRIKLLALLHDLSETIISDVPSPFKVPELKQIEERIQKRLYASVGLKPTKKDLELLAVADHRAFIGEIGTVATNMLRKYYSGRDRQAEQIVLKYAKKYTTEDSCKANGKAVQEFIKRFRQLTKEKH